MAMLAEPKRRQKLSVDPRNKAWISDGCKFGEKLMKKMGWQEGKGLGMNEDGSTDSIKVTLKNNSSGLGFSQQHEDNWIGHQDDFNDLLSSLNQDHSTTEDKDTTSTPQNLPEKSTKSKKRVHRYKKFKQGKDLSSRSTSDLNSIMGVRSNSGTPKNRSHDPSRVQSETNSAAGSDSDSECVVRTGFGFASTSVQQDVSVQDNSFGVQTITSSNSIQEYFALKMKELQKKRTAEAVSPSNVVASSNNEPNDAESMETVSEKTAVDNDLGSEVVNQRMKKKKSKKKRKEKQDVLVEDLSLNGDLSESHDQSHDKSHDVVDETESSSLRRETNAKKRKKKRKIELENGDECSVDVGKKKKDT